MSKTGGDVETIDEIDLTIESTPNFDRLLCREQTIHDLAVLPPPLSLATGQLSTFDGYRQIHLPVNPIIGPSRRKHVNAIRIPKRIEDDEVRFGRKQAARGDMSRAAGPNEDVDSGSSLEIQIQTPGRILTRVLTLVRRRVLTGTSGAGGSSIARR